MESSGHTGRGESRKQRREFWNVNKENGQKVSFRGRDNKKKKERKERKGAQKKREGKELLSFCSKIFYKIERKFKEWKEIGTSQIGWKKNLR